MKRIVYAFACFAVVMAGCNNFKKTKEGILYRIISDNKGEKIKNGDFFEIRYTQSYKGTNLDTVLESSKDFGNQIIPLDSQALPPVYYKIFSQVRNGDSVIVKQLSDSLMKHGNTPPFFKKGQFLIMSIKIVNLFATKEQADSARKSQVEIVRVKDSVKAIAQLAKDDKVLTEYFAKNKIDSVKKAPEGTYVQILSPGTGDAIDTSKVVKVNYSGKVLGSNELFDSNTDPAFNHVEPIKISMAPGGGVIKGWPDGLSLLKKGAKARFYIPSALGYGPRGGGGGKIKPNDNLYFDIEVVDVISAAQAKAEAEADRKKYEDMQKKMMDAMQKQKDSASQKK